MALWYCVRVNTWLQKSGLIWLSVPSLAGHVPFISSIRKLGDIRHMDVSIEQFIIIKLTKEEAEEVLAELADATEGSPSDKQRQRGRTVTPKPCSQKARKDNPMMNEQMRTGYDEELNGVCPTCRETLCCCFCSR